MDLQHKAFTIYLGGALYRAPIGRPEHVLDIATGTGIWAIKFAQEHPQATVIGTDLSMIQPSEHILHCTPMSCVFLDSLELKRVYTIVLRFNPVGSCLNIIATDQHIIS